MADTQKLYISPNDLRLDSFRLAEKLHKDGFRPDFLVALWRGGAPIAMNVHEYLKWHGCDADHIAIRTSRYVGIDQVAEAVEVHSTSYLCEKLKPGSSILLVDDVWDSGTTIVAFYEKLEKSLNFPVNQLDIRVAVVYYKPSRNQTALMPRYYLKETTEWLVFPHELEGMDMAEIEKAMGPEIASLMSSSGARK
jgi:hypothetical protein